MDKQFITMKEFCETCNICHATARKAMKTHKVRFRKCQEGRLHYYQIRMQDVIRFKKEYEERGILSDEQVEERKMYCTEKLKDYPPLITSKDIQNITGYGKETVRHWINSEKVLGVVVRGKFCVAKVDLLAFLIIP